MANAGAGSGGVESKHILLNSQVRKLNIKMNAKTQEKQTLKNRLPKKRDEPYPNAYIPSYFLPS